MESTKTDLQIFMSAHSLHTGGWTSEDVAKVLEKVKELERNEAIKSFADNEQTESKS